MEGLWICKACDNEVEDYFKKCWKCGADRVLPQPPPIPCGRCAAAMIFMGSKHFHEGPRYGMMGDFAELLVNKEPFDVYVCPSCGKIELFSSTIGVENRPRFGS